MLKVTALSGFDLAQSLFGSGSQQKDETKPSQRGPFSITAFCILKKEGRANHHSERLFITTLYLKNQQRRGPFSITASVF
jgi:hypothetical protein